LRLDRERLNQFGIRSEGDRLQTGENSHKHARSHQQDKRESHLGANQNLPKRDASPATERCRGIGLDASSQVPARQMNGRRETEQRSGQD